MRYVEKCFVYYKIHYCEQDKNGGYDLTTVKHLVEYPTRPMGERKAKMILHNHNPNLKFIGVTEHEAYAKMSFEKFVACADEYKELTHDEGEKLA